MLNPKAAAGSRSFKFKSDNVQLPRTAFNFNSAFVVTSVNSSPSPTYYFKIKFNASPVVIAEIYDPQAGLVVSGAKTFKLDNIIYVLGSKTQQLGEVNERYEFSPKIDWKKYRCTGYSGSSSWVGREIDKCGTIYAARMNEEVPIADFDPTLKQDVIFSQAFKDQSFAATHKEPVYDWLYVDPNEAIIDETATGKPNTSEIAIKIFLGNSDDAVAGGGTATSWPYLPGVSFNATNNTFQKLWASGNTYNNRNINYVADQLTTENNKWHFIAMTSTSYSMDVAMDWEIEPLFTDDSITPAQASGSFPFTATGSSILDLAKAMFTQLNIAIQDISIPPYNTTQSAPQMCSTRVIFTMKFKPSGHMLRTYDRNVKMVRSIPASFAVAELDGLFCDRTFAQPVLEYNLPLAQVSNSFAFQFIHNTNYELIVDDASVLANYAVAADVDKQSDVVDIQNEKIQHIMQSLPPMITFDGGILSGTATTELASRGAIKDIFSVLGPLASTIFPEITPFLPIGGAIASAVDGIF